MGWHHLGAPETDSLSLPNDVYNSGRPRVAAVAAHSFPIAMFGDYATTTFDQTRPAVCWRPRIRAGNRPGTFTTPTQQVIKHLQRLGFRRRGRWTKPSRWRCLVTRVGVFTPTGIISTVARHLVALVP